MNKTIWDRVLDFAMMVAAAMLYFKTAQVMTVFAPSVVFGYTGLEVLFGNVSALLVEGIVLALHFIPSMKKNDAAQAFKWFLFAISAFCQVVDGFVVQNTLSQQPESIQFVVSWGVPLIPTIIFLGLLVIGASNEEETAPRKPKKGIRRAWREFLDGSPERPERPENTVLSQDVQTTKAVKPSKNGESQEEDFTLRQGR